MVPSDCCNKVHLKKTDGFVPITNESPAEEQHDTFVAKEFTSVSSQQSGKIVTYFVRSFIVSRLSTSISTN